jgi:hypothetical protein
MARKIFIVFIVFFSLLVLISAGLYFAFKSNKIREFAVDTVVDRLVKNQTVTSTVSVTEETNFIKKLLGFNGTQTYLVLLLNNTELRPGGGFIGSYATIELDHAIPHILKVEGTELLDYSGYPTNFSSIPPLPFSTYLKLDRWYFRDSNWSPDFPHASAKALELYQKEQGVAGEHITQVVGITTTVLEELLKITGPLTVNGEEFTSSNVVEKLEYEVEQGYREKGLARDARKQFLSDLVKTMTEHIARNLVTHWSDYYQLSERMFQEKQVALYSTDAADQKIIAAKQWGGEMKQTTGDYLLWVDANLGALKTDAALQRDLSYTITPVNGKYVATVTMKYTHTKALDWRTSRYLTYARLYIPQGSQLISSQGFTKNAAGVPNSPLDQGDENGRHWIGGFTSVEPLSTKEVKVQFIVAPNIVEQVLQGNYQLLVQKELGTVNHTLTLHLDFGKSISMAIPANHSGTVSTYCKTLNHKKSKRFI